MGSDTIAAISTPVGRSGIGIIRISGSQAFEKILPIFRDKNRQVIKKFQSRRIHYGFIYNPIEHQVMDEVLVMAMQAPHTYTKEDIIEINCHSSGIILNRVLQFVLDQGIRLAEPGEFTKRAFINGRIDLAQAEAVMSYLQAESEISVHNALGQMSGALSDKITTLREQLLSLMAHIEVAIDYPEHDEAEVTSQLILQTLEDIRRKIDVLYSSYKAGKIISEGIKTVILGKTNVGKSSLLNYLLQQDKAIVTDIPGTTRDVLEAPVNMGGVLMRLIDTAGIRETQDPVEQIGVEKAKQMAESADLILFVLDATRQVDKADLEIMSLVDNCRILALINKTDLDPTPDISCIADKLGMDNVLHISLKTGQGVEKFVDKVKNLFLSGQVEATQGETVTNARHYQSLSSALLGIDGALETVNAGFPPELASTDLKMAYDALGEIIGVSLEDDLVDKIFADFCLGK